MSLFRQNIVLMLGALLAMLVFSGDILDDVWNLQGSTATTHSLQSSDQQKDGAPNTNLGSHDDTVVLGSPMSPLIPALPCASRYLDIDEAAPVGVPPAIDHPPQLA